MDAPSSIPVRTAGRAMCIINEMWRSLVSARGWGPRGRGFESLHLDTDCWPDAPGLTSKATAEGERAGKLRGIGVPSPSGEPGRGVHPHSEAQASTTGSSSGAEHSLWERGAGISRLPFPTSSAAQCGHDRMANVPAFQAGDEGSIPSGRSMVSYNERDGRKRPVLVSWLVGR